MVQYYTLQEAAEKLHITPDQLKEMAKKNEVRAFQDRGNFRFRAQEIDELARIRGVGSDPELQLGETREAPKSSGPKSSVRGTKSVPPADEDFSINLDDESEEVPIGGEPSASASKNTPRNTSTRSPKPKRSGLGSASPPPSPRPGSDSDVRLVGDGGGLDFQVDSDVKVEKSPAAPKTPGGRKSKLDPAPDSGVRIVPLDDAGDSDVKIIPDDPDSKVPLGQPKSKTPSDSDIRLEHLGIDSGKVKRDERGLITEEIDLDAEEMKAAQEAAARKKSGKTKAGNVGSSAQLPTVSPFELSDPDLNLPPTSGKKQGKRPSKVEKKAKEEPDDTDSSSDFELTPASEIGSSPIELGSDEMTPIKFDDDSDEEVGLGELTGGGAGTSGISLDDPVDSGISLEQGGSDEMEFEVGLEGGKTPKPSQKVDSSSEFELSLDDSDMSPTDGESSSESDSASDSEFELTLDEGSSPAEEGSDSEFELSLDLEESSDLEIEKVQADSDSEFELTIDEGGSLSASDEEEALDEDKDIFAPTDFDVPALEEESGSEAVALDDVESELESSDFDLDVDEEESTDSESASEVVALESDDDIEDVKPAARKKTGRTVLTDDEDEPSEFEDLEAEGEVEADEEEAEEEQEKEVVGAAAVPAPPASWGVVSPLAATFTAFIMFFVCLMSYEMIASMWGYHRSTKVSSLIIDPLARALFDDPSAPFPKD